MKLWRKFCLSSARFWERILENLLEESEKAESDLKEAYNNENYEGAFDLLIEWQRLQSEIDDVKRRIAHYQECGAILGKVNLEDVNSKEELEKRILDEALGVSEGD